MSKDYDLGSWVIGALLVIGVVVAIGLCAYYQGREDGKAIQNATSQMLTFKSQTTILRSVYCAPVAEETNMTDIDERLIDALSDCALIEATPELWERYDAYLRSYSLCYVVTAQDGQKIGLGKCGL